MRPFSTSDIRRDSPSFKSSSNANPPMAVRFNHNTLCPKDPNIRFIWWYLPSEIFISTNGCDPDFRIRNFAGKQSVPSAK